MSKKMEAEIGRAIRKKQEEYDDLVSKRAKINDKLEKINKEISKLNQDYEHERNVTNWESGNKVIDERFQYYKKQGYPDEESKKKTLKDFSPL